MLNPEEVERTIRFQIQTGRQEESIPLLRKMIQAQPQNLSYHGELAKIYESLLMNDEAISVYLRIGMQLAEQGLLRQSLTVLEKANSLNPRNTKILWKMLVVQSRLLEQVTQETPEHAEEEPSVPKLSNEQLERIRRLVDHTISRNRRVKPQPFDSESHGKAS